MSQTALKSGYRLTLDGGFVPLSLIDQYGLSLEEALRRRNADPYRLRIQWDGADSADVASGSSEPGGAGSATPDRAGGGASDDWEDWDYTEI